MKTIGLIGGMSWESTIPYYTIINDIIFNELCVGNLKKESQETMARIIKELKQNGAEAVILGCTEIGLLVTPETSELPIFDTTVIHATRAAELSYEE